MGPALPAGHVGPARRPALAPGHPVGLRAPRPARGWAWGKDSSPTRSPPTPEAPEEPGTGRATSGKSHGHRVEVKALEIKDSARLSWKLAPG